jgi:hypothetical protein
MNAEFAIELHLPKYTQSTRSKSKDDRVHLDIAELFNTESTEEILEYLENNLNWSTTTKLRFAKVIKECQILLHFIVVSETLKDNVDWDLLELRLELCKGITFRVCRQVYLVAKFNYGSTWMIEEMVNSLAKVRSYLHNHLNNDLMSVRQPTKHLVFIIDRTDKTDLEILKAEETKDGETSVFIRDPDNAIKNFNVLLSVAKPNLRTILSTQFSRLVNLASSQFRERNDQRKAVNTESTETGPVNTECLPSLDQLLEKFREDDPPQKSPGYFPMQLWKNLVQIIRNLITVTLDKRDDPKMNHLTYFYITSRIPEHLRELESLESLVQAPEKLFDVGALLLQLRDCVENSCMMLGEPMEEFLTGKYKDEAKNYRFYKQS